jgi:hypothetical protein
MRSLFFSGSSPKELQNETNHWTLEEVSQSGQVLCFFQWLESIPRQFLCIEEEQIQRESNSLPDRLESLWLGLDESDIENAIDRLQTVCL